VPENGIVAIGADFYVQVVADRIGDAGVIERIAAAEFHAAPAEIFELHHGECRGVGVISVCFVKFKTHRNPQGGADGMILPDNFHVFSGGAEPVAESVQLFGGAAAFLFQNLWRGLHGVGEKQLSVFKSTGNAVLPIYDASRSEANDKGG